MFPRKLCKNNLTKSIKNYLQLYIHVIYTNFLNKVTWSNLLLNVYFTLKLWTNSSRIDSVLHNFTRTLYVKTSHVCMHSRMRARTHTHTHTHIKSQSREPTCTNIIKWGWWL
jgi:hypothetical protein